jgi:Ca2+-binding RTX toxin-like protein
MRVRPSGYGDSMVQTTSYQLISGGFCENGASNFTDQVTPFGWQLAYGAFSGVGYYIGGPNELNQADADSVGGGTYYFAGGLDGISAIQQDIDVSSMSGAVDLGGVQFELSADLGGYLDQDDYMDVIVRFLDASGTLIAASVLEGPSAAERGGETKLMHEELSGAVPADTRFVKVSLRALRESGSYNDAYADNISLVFRGENLPGGFAEITQDTDLTGDALNQLATIFFNAPGPVTLKLRAEQFGAGIRPGAAMYSNLNHPATIDVVIGESHLFFGSALNLGAGLTFLVHGTSANDSIGATTAADFISAGGGADTISGAYTSDTIRTGAGDDFLISGSLDVRIAGGDGADALLIQGAGVRGALTRANFNSFESLALATFGRCVIRALDSTVADTGVLPIDASAMQAGGRLVFKGDAESGGRFQIAGSDFNDVISGGGAADVIGGGRGADTMTGNGGGDTFVFAGLVDSRTKTPDLITDFAHGDRIDLAAIDANTSQAGNQAFHLGVTPGHTGDIYVSYNPVTDQTQIALFVNGDTTVDAVIVLDGSHLGVTAADLVL